MNFIIPKPIEKAMQIMKDNGFESYIVGGSVRDYLMGKTPHDFDITTNALPEETKKCFLGYKVIETGIKHGTVTVLIDDEPIEITTYRIDGKYTDNRHPESVEFTVKLSDDLSRRDFTVNALAYNGESEICDLFSGREDLENKIIRCVGEPDKRFCEDGLRILRALRFSSVLGFVIEAETEKSIRKNKELLNNISRERILAELTKLICGINAKSVLLKFREVFEVFIPELKNSPDYEDCVEAMYRLDTSKEIRFSALLAHCDNPDGILKNLKSDRNTINTVKALTEDLREHIAEDEVCIKKMLVDREFSHLLNVVDLKCAFGEDIEKCRRIKQIIEKIQKSGECVKLSQLNISGNDIIKEELASGKQVGEMLKFLLFCVIEGKARNEREQLIALAKEKPYHV